MSDRVRIGGAPSGRGGNRPVFASARGQVLRVLEAPRLARNERSGRQPLAAMGAAARDHQAAILGGHALAEAVAALADELARLIGALHDNLRKICPIGPKGPCFYRAAFGLSTEAAGD